MEKSDGPANHKPVFGEAMQKAMAERGCHLTLEESQEFVKKLLRLAEIGALVPIHKSDEPSSMDEGEGNVT